jgi:hypothetical protein
LGSKQKSLNKRIRETISCLSDEDLDNMLGASPQTHTPFARQVAEEEVARRREMKTTSGARDADPAALRKEAAGDKRADCYIEVWSDKNFDGECIRIEGPVECGALEFAGQDWGDSISSLRVGPTAFVLMYADKEFKGNMMSFGPGQEVSNLEELNFNDEIDSIMLVNSIKVFDELRREDVGKPPGGCPPKKKRNKEGGRRKPRADRNL